MKYWIGRKASVRLKLYFCHVLCEDNSTFEVKMIIVAVID